MANALPTPGSILDLLSAAPDRLAVATKGVADERLRTAPVPGAWSAVEVLAHLRACGDVWGRAIARILAEDHPTFRAVSPRTWIDSTDYAHLDPTSSLQAYAVQRAELLALLRSLAPADWERAATVIGGGRPLDKTVRSYADRLARHERPHLEQIARAADGR